MLGKVYLRMKNYKTLPSVFSRIMQINPNSASAHIMMAMAYDKMSDQPNAIKEYQAAEASDPHFMGVHSGLGYIYWRLGQDRTGGERDAGGTPALSQRSRGDYPLPRSNPVE